jgi:hypothetical protein
VKDKRGEKFRLSIIIVKESKKDKKILLFTKKLLIKLSAINTSKMLLFIVLNSTFKVSKIFKVSL